MAEVFLARDQLLDRPVAVKVLFAEFAADPSFVERFRLEAKAAANLSHPNIVGVYDWGREGNTYYIVMEYVQGQSLSEILRTMGPLPFDKVAEVGDGVAAALGFAHKNDFVHRDMKSGNVMISPTGQVKVADFGIATAISGGAQANLTQTGAVMGTATYFSPEQAQGRPLDGRSDLYSLGVVMYEMLTGSAPFTGDNPVAIAYKHVQEQPEPIVSKRPDVPPALAAIVAKLLAKEPDDRYPAASDLQADLRRFQAGGHQLAAPAASAPPQVPITGAPASAPPAAAAPPQRPAASAHEYAPAPAATAVNPQVTQANAAAGGYAGGPAGDYYDDYEEPPRNVWPWLIGMGALLAALIILVVVLLNTVGGDSDGDDGEVETAQVTVPEVTTLDRQRAADVLEGRGLTVGEIETRLVEDDTPPDRVLEQSPMAGEEVDEGTPVDLVVSVGPEAIALPDVVGRTEDEARQLLTDAGFENVEFRSVEDDEVEEGLVVAQQPSAGEELDPAAVVVIELSEGPGSEQVPNLEGQVEADAVRILEDLGWTVTVEEVEDDDIAEGLVVSTDPGAGTDLDVGEDIVLRVSQGPGVVRVPNVIGDAPEDATTTLVADGLVATPDTCIIDDPDNQVPGTVIEQLPAGGVEVAKGSEVTICVGVEPDPTPTPVPTATPTPTPAPEPTATPTPTPTEPPEDG